MMIVTLVMVMAVQCNDDYSVVGNGMQWKRTCIVNMAVAISMMVVVVMKM